MGKKAFTFARLQIGMNDSLIPFLLRDMGYDVLNIDDRVWLWNRSNSFFYKFLMKIFKHFFIKNMNRFILNEIDGVPFDFAFIFKGQHLSINVIKILKKNGAKIVIFYPDLEPWSHSKEYLEICRYADYFVHTKPNLHKEMAQKVRHDAICMPHSYYSSEIVNPLSLNKDIDVSFIGHYSKKKYKSLMHLHNLVKCNIHVYGDRWPLKNTKNIFFHEATYGFKIKDIISRSKVSLGFLMESLSGEFQGDALTSRSILVPIFGTLCLHERNEFSKQLYEDENILFSDIYELAEKINKIIKKRDSYLTLALNQQQQVVNKVKSFESILNTFI